MSFSDAPSLAKLMGKNICPFPLKAWMP